MNLCLPLADQTNIILEDRHAKKVVFFLFELRHQALDISMRGYMLNSSEKKIAATVTRLCRSTTHRRHVQPYAKAKKQNRYGFPSRDPLQQSWPSLVNPETPAKINSTIVQRCSFQKKSRCCFPSFQVDLNFLVLDPRTALPSCKMSFSLRPYNFFFPL